RRVPGGAAPDRARRDRARGGTPARLQRRAAARRRAAVPHRSGDVQDLLVGGRRASGLAGRQPVRRQRLREGVSGREAVPRREDRPDLRGHVEPPAADDRQAAPGLTWTGVPLDRGATIAAVAIATAGTSWREGFSRAFAAPLTARCN